MSLAWEKDGIGWECAEFVARRFKQREGRNMPFLPLPGPVGAGFCQGGVVHTGLPLRGHVPWR